MVDRYAMETFRRYCEVRRLSPAEARAELERFDNLMLGWGQRAGEAGRRVTAPARTAKHPFGSRCGLVNASWTS